MNVDEVITLEDGKEYVLLLDSMIDGSRYFLAVEVVNNVPTENYELFREVIEGADISVEQVEDTTIQEKLIEDFDNQFEANEDKEEQE